MNVPAELTTVQPRARPARIQLVLSRVPATLVSQEAEWFVLISMNVQPERTTVPLEELRLARIQRGRSLVPVMQATQGMV